MALTITVLIPNNSIDEYFEEKITKKEKFLDRLVADWEEYIKEYKADLENIDSLRDKIRSLESENKLWISHVKELKEGSDEWEHKCSVAYEKKIEASWINPTNGIFRAN